MIRKAQVLVNGVLAGILEEIAHDTNQISYRFSYKKNYIGAPISLTMPRSTLSYEFKQFPAFFEGLLPEGPLLEALLRKYKIDKHDYFGQLLQVGHDVVGAVTIEAMS